MAGAVEPRASWKSLRPPSQRRNAASAGLPSGGFRTYSDRRVRIYLSYRENDAAGLAFSLRRQIQRIAPHVEILSAPVAPDDAQRLPAQCSVLLLIGERGLRPAPDAAPYLADAGDQVRRAAELARGAEQRIVPVLQGVTTDEWAALASEVPELEWFFRLNVLVVDDGRFTEQVEKLVASLAAPDTGLPWSENEGRSIIEVRMGDGGLLKWYSGRDKALTVFIDGESVGGLDVWKGRLASMVEPGRHAVQVKDSGWGATKSKPVDVEVPPAKTVSLVCERNIFTGGMALTLEQ